ncbi:39S ribosomal protein L50, mitochondrial [Sphaerodactylus townsendi]|uniref:39S ribosomal protein L50, mitochondrial n=1 Tax=Sphaerodactylus townsendi TaxID=933632 RepID=UPI0020273E84|nr:39S ribosomal protein L50, mitochondrial [Sphaerodactylus townsendi]
MAAATGLLRVCKRRLHVGVPARRALWGGERKKQEEAEAVDPAVSTEKQPVLVCPPLRSRKYLPPDDLQSRLEARVREIFGSSTCKDWQQVSLEESKLKYRLLVQLAEDLGHVVPNSRLHQMKNASDVLAFYSTPVKDGSKFDEMSTQELPPNLRIRWQY